VNEGRADFPLVGKGGRGKRGPLLGGITAIFTISGMVRGARSLDGRLSSQGEGEEKKESPPSLARLGYRGEIFLSIICEEYGWVTSVNWCRSVREKEEEWGPSFDQSWLRRTPMVSLCAARGRGRKGAGLPSLVGGQVYDSYCMRG